MRLESCAFDRHLLAPIVETRERDQDSKRGPRVDVEYNTRREKESGNRWNEKDDENFSARPGGSFEFLAVASQNMGRNVSLSDF